MYHLWRMDKRRRMMLLVGKKRIGHWDDGETLAIWTTRQAAQKYGAHEYGKDNIMVRACEGVECGIAECRKEW